MHSHEFPQSGTPESEINGRNFNHTGKQQALMAARTSPPCSLFPDAMDRTWMHNNVLFSVPRGICNTKASSESTRQPAEPASGCSSDKGTLKTEKKKKKRLTRLHACPSLTKMSSYHDSDVKILKRQYSRSQKSLSELERNEVEGFMDLGFVFRKEELSVEIMNMIPGLQRLGMGEEEGTDQEGRREEEEGVERPYLSEAWLTSVDPEFSLVKLPLYSAEEMKEELRIWAKEVASYVTRYNFVDGR